MKQKWSCYLKSGNRFKSLSLIKDDEFSSKRYDKVRNKIKHPGTQMIKIMDPSDKDTTKARCPK